MRPNYIRWLILAGLAAFVPLFYYLAVVGGFLPYGGILLIAIRHPTDVSMLTFNFVHLAVYGALLYWLSGRIARAIHALGNGRAWLATALVLLLAGIGAMPIFGIAHGRIQWTSAYALYASDRLK